MLADIAELLFVALFAFSCRLGPSRRLGRHWFAIVGVLTAKSETALWQRLSVP